MPTSHKNSCWHFLLFVPLYASFLSKTISFSNMILVKLKVKEQRDATEGKNR